MQNIKLETQRLYLRELTENDINDLYILDSDAEVHQYLGGKPVNSLEESLAQIKFIKAQYVTNGIGRWAVINKSTNEFLGWAGFKLITESTNNHINYYDLGYRFIKKHWGNGYATEVAKALVFYAFNTMKVKNIFAIADTDNKTSIQVLEKAGLKKNNTFIYQGLPHYWFELEKKTT